MSRRNSISPPAQSRPTSVGSNSKTKPLIKEYKMAKPDVSKIYGKIKFVESFPDFKVKVVTSFADLHVKIVDSFPNDPGKWKIVDSFPDYKIKIVDSFPDFTIKYVESFPGPQ